ncbi:MAG: hypothetical protein Q9217_002573 [Psora testacea]
MDEESRTAPFQRKRPSDKAASSDESRPGSSTKSAPRKRAKYEIHQSHHDIRDFVPNGDSFSTNRDSLDQEQNAEVLGLSSVSQQVGDEAHPQQDHPPLAELQGSSVEIITTARTAISNPHPSSRVNTNVRVATCPSEIPSLKDIKPGSTVGHKVKLPVKENQAYSRYFSRALKSLLEARTRLSNVKRVEAATEALHEVEIDFRWCQYYPLQDNWHAPPPPGARELSVGSSATRKARNRFRAVVEQSMKDGTLLDLRAGKLGGIDNSRGEESEDEGLDVQTRDTRKASERYQMELQRLRRNSPKMVKAYDAVLKKVHRAEVDLNYCQYYPLNRMYQPLSEWRKIGSEIVDVIPLLNGTPAQLWKLVEKCMSTGQLQKLKEGQLDQNPGHLVTAARRGSDSVQSIRPVIPVASAGPEDINPEGSAAGMPKAIARAHRSDSSSSEDSETVKINIGLNGDELVRDADIENTAEYINDISQAPAETVEISQNDRQSNGEDSISTAVDILDDSRNSDADDAMKEYADSERTPNWNGQQQSPSKPEPKRGTRVLADLDPEDINAQLRYFLFSKDGKKDYLSIPIRCLVCGKAGHMSMDCEQLVCADCGANNEHITANCPTSAKCAKCREQGHKESSCPYKLKNMSRHEMICDLCKRSGHIEDECELFWRTSGRPWESDLIGQKTRIFCYECGKYGHLGNDCTTRQPGKAMGTSTWSLRNAGPTPSIFGDTSIHSKVQRPFPTSNADENHDHGNFCRPKAPQRAQKGQIRINVAKSKTVESFQPTWTPVNQRNPRDEHRRNQYEDPGRRRSEVYQSHRNDYQSDGPDSYGPNNFRRQHRDGHTYHRGDQYPPPPQQLGRHHVQQPKSHNAYRPMPSAAQNAWSRHRV